MSTDIISRFSKYILADNRTRGSRRCSACSCRVFNNPNYNLFSCPPTLIPYYTCTYVGMKFIFTCCSWSKSSCASVVIRSSIKCFLIEVSLMPQIILACIRKIINGRPMSSFKHVLWTRRACCSRRPAGTIVTRCTRGSGCTHCPTAARFLDCNLGIKQGNRRRTHRAWIIGFVLDVISDLRRCTRRI